MHTSVGRYARTRWTNGHRSWWCWRRCLGRSAIAPAAEEAHRQRCNAEEPQKSLNSHICTPLFVCLLSPAADRLKKREPGIGETLDNSHYAFEKRSLGGKNPPTRAVKLHANFMRILRALNAEVVASLSIGCRYIVACWVGAGGSPNQDADVTGLAEGNMIMSDSASSRSVLRSRRPQTRLETWCARTGRLRRCLRRGSAVGRREKAMAIRPACTSPRSRTAEYYL